jgi:hypothetical protein
LLLVLLHIDDNLYVSDCLTGSVPFWWLCHGYFRDNTALLEDLGRIMRGTPLQEGELSPEVQGCTNCRTNADTEEIARSILPPWERPRSINLDHRAAGPSAQPAAASPEGLEQQAAGSGSHVSDVAAPGNSHELQAAMSSSSYYSCEIEATAPGKDQEQQAADSGDHKPQAAGLVTHEMQAAGNGELEIAALDDSRRPQPDGSSDSNTWQPAFGGGGRDNEDDSGSPAGTRMPHCCCVS